MQLSSSTPIDLILQGVFNTYSERVPDVKKITQAMIDKGMVSSQS